MVTKRFQICKEASKVVEDTKTQESFLCYNEDIAKELVDFLNQEVTGSSKPIYEMNAFELIHNKDQLITDYNAFMKTYRAKEAKLLLETQFKELGLTNEKMRNAYITKEMAKEKDARNAYELSIEIVNDLLRLRMKEKGVIS